MSTKHIVEDYTGRNLFLADIRTATNRIHNAHNFAMIILSHSYSPSDGFGKIADRRIIVASDFCNIFMLRCDLLGHGVNFQMTSSDSTDVGNP